jgi:hypothetical protein
MLIVGMFIGAGLFAAGVIVGTRLDIILKSLTVNKQRVYDQLRRKSPLEGKNGMLSYRNLKLRFEDSEDDDE